MKIVKFLVGSLCLQIALLITIAVFIGPQFPTDVSLTLAAVWLAFTGAWLVMRRKTPMSPAARIGFFLNAGLCAVFLFAVGIPSFVHSRATCCGNACLNNLRQIDAAANQFALEQHLTNGAPIHFPDDLTPYIKLNAAGKIPGCPDGGVYHISKVGESPTCSLGANVTPGHYLP